MPEQVHIRQTGPYFPDVAPIAWTWPEEALGRSPERPPERLPERLYSVYSLYRPFVAGAKSDEIGYIG